MKIKNILAILSLGMVSCVGLEQYCPVLKKVYSD